MYMLSLLQNFNDNEINICDPVMLSYYSISLPICKWEFERIHRTCFNCHCQKINKKETGARRRP